KTRLSLCSCCVSTWCGQRSCTGPRAYLRWGFQGDHTSFRKRTSAAVGDHHHPVWIEHIDLESKGGEALLSANQDLNRDDIDDGRSSDLANATATAWYAIWPRSHCERLVAQQLTAKGFQPFLPEMAVRPRRADAGAIVQRP